MNKTTGIIIAILVIIAGIYLINKMPNKSGTVSNSNETSNSTGKNNTSNTTQGRVVFSITDAAVNMASISEVSMSVSKVEIHSTASGWVTISTTPKTYDLLTLNKTKKSLLVTDTKTKAGVYDQVRLTVDSVLVKTTSGAVKTAKLPSGELKINTTLAVAADNVSSVNLDFMAKDSLHTTGLGEYIFAPVVKTETQGNVNLTIDGSGNVSIVSGRIDSTNTSGMDIDGSVKVNFKIDDRQKLQIGTDNTIKVEGLLNQ